MPSASAIRRMLASPTFAHLARHRRRKCGPTRIGRRNPLERCPDYRVAAHAPRAQRRRGHWSAEPSPERCRCGVINTTDYEHLRLVMVRDASAAPQALALVDLARGLGHPTRLAVLEEMRTRSTSMSPKELADTLVIPLGSISYHVRTLRALGLVEIVQTVPRRGALEHRYRIAGPAEQLLTRLL